MEHELHLRRSCQLEVVGADLVRAVRTFLASYVPPASNVLLMHTDATRQTADLLTRLQATRGGSAVSFNTSMNDETWAREGAPALCERLKQGQPFIVNMFSKHYGTSQPLSELWLQYKLPALVTSPDQFKLCLDMTDELFARVFTVPATELRSANRSILARLAGVDHLTLRSGIAAELQITIGADRWDEYDGLRPEQYELPGGEVAATPIDAVGTFVVGGGMLGTLPIGRKYGMLPDGALTVKIRDCKVTEVHSPNPELQRDVELCLGAEEGADALAEIGIGTHPAITSITGLNYAWEERCRGPHLGFGAQVPALRDEGHIVGHHLDFILPSAQIWADGRHIF